MFALPAITPVANGNWDPVTGGGSVGDKVEGAPACTQHSKLYENELPNTPTCRWIELPNE